MLNKGQPDTITVLIEYVPSQKRVMVRAAWRDGKEYLEPLEPDNKQNYVSVFDGVDMKYHTGFQGLEPC